jgi:3-mercaptopyruvate sulfurtransferase SseA
VLDGGFPAWKNADHAVDTGENSQVINNENKPE